MCGIGGILRTDGQPIPEEWLDAIDAPEYEAVTAARRDDLADEHVGAVARVESL